MSGHDMPRSLIRNGDPIGLRGSVLTTPEGKSLARVVQRNDATLTTRDFYWYERAYYRVTDFGRRLIAAVR